MPSSPAFWIPSINPPLDGEAVNQQVTGRPLSELAKRDAFLFNQLQSLALASGRLVRTQAPIVTGVVAGNVVYWNAVEEAFAPAIAEIGYNSSTGAMEASPRAFASGLVLSASGTTGDILVFGCVSPSGGDIPGVTPETLGGLLDSSTDYFSDGIYYLSRKVAGKISKSPSFPRVQLGHFASGLFVFAPRFDGMPNGHVHHEFSLSAKPSASQNFARTGYDTYGDGSATAYKAVDYFNKGSSGTPPDIILCLRRNSSPLSSTAKRVEVYNTAGQLGIEILSGVDYALPNGAGSSTITLSPQDWPVWGEWITIPGTGLDVSFIHRSASYGSTLAAVAASQLTSSVTHRFKIFLPNDMTGWTNANLLDPNVAAGTRYLYLSNLQPGLSAAWPPLPLESTRLERNGVGLLVNEDFKATLMDLFYVKTGDSAPWPTDYDIDGTMAAANAVSLKLAFTGPVSDNADQLVTNLFSGSPSLRIERCPEGGEASTGSLKIFLDLALGIQSTLAEGFDTAFVSVDGEELQRGPIVSELEAGAGIVIERLDGTGANAQLGSRKAGKLRITRADAILNGEFSTVALRNAKEIVKNGLSYMYFLQPSVSPTGIDARFRIPFADVNPLTATLRIRSLFMGAKSLGVLGASTARFQAVTRIVRAGMSLDSIAPLATQFWEIPFGNSYVANTILDAEYPDESLILGPSGFEDGDIITLDLSRVASTGTEYAGDVACVSLAWQIAT